MMLLRGTLKLSLPTTRPLLLASRPFLLSFRLVWEWSAPPGSKFLDVPKEQKEEAKSLGAKWDPTRQSWFDASGDNRALAKWQRPPSRGDPSVQRTFLCVPFNETNKVKALGAKFDYNLRMWYAPPEYLNGLKEWVPRLPELRSLEGEDLEFGGKDKLFVDLIPKPSWYNNVRNRVTFEDFCRLRKMVVARNEGRCECCGQYVCGKLEMHERWEYVMEEEKGGKQVPVQRLKRLIGLCKPCHISIHMGLAELLGKKDKAMTHLMQVTGMSKKEAEKHVDEAFALWRERNAHNWKIDLSLLTNNGIHVLSEDKMRKPQLKDPEE